MDNEAELASLKLPLLRYAANPGILFENVWPILTVNAQAFVTGLNYATISIALGGATFRQATVASAVINQYKTMIEEATSNLQEHLQDIEETLQSLDQHGGPVQRSDTFNLRDTREERESIIQCLNKRLLQRMKARGIPEDLLRWVEAFCSERMATIQINGQLSEVHSLLPAGLLQGSPLSPILFLFFNADLVQRQIDSRGGAIAFVDDFTAWVTGPTAQNNREGIEGIITEALDWERRSGAIFEAEKIAIIHITPKAYKLDREPFTIKGQTVEPKHHVKILGVLVDIMDYASNVWMHTFGNKATGPINRVQRVGAQAIVGTFLTVATSVAEAEAHIATAQHRFWRRAVKMWTDLHTLPDTNPLRRTTARFRKFRRVHRSPLYQVADALKNIDMETLETINPFTLAPWETRMQTDGETMPDPQSAPGGSMQIAISSSARNGFLHITTGVAIEKQPPRYRKLKLKTFSMTLGARSEQNPFSAELAAIAHTLNGLVVLKGFRLRLLTINKAAALTIQNPRQHSGQEFVCLTYSEDNKLLGLAKEQARAATHEDAIPQAQVSRMKSTMLNLARSQAVTMKALPEDVGRHVKRVDAVLPGKHT
ncbi:reverse transcriptase [Aspergillus luchuensis IFO 4308]|nr:reverse transcriptase [Aspergillus luchuensis IFO 4308]